MTETIAIVAIPQERSRIHKISTEKRAHMTLLFLGENTPDVDLELIRGHVEHVAKQSFGNLYMEVSERGVLGDDKADVLFLSKKSLWFQNANHLRNQLLQNEVINKLFHSTDQYPEWLPHVTLGYPKSPAKEKVDEDYISFDRLALWVGDYTGEEFKLSSSDNVVESDWTMHSNDDLIDNVLMHYGVKGMKWGRRKSESSGGKESAVSRLKKKLAGPDGPEDVSVTVTPGKRVSTTGGRKQNASDDAITAAKSKQVAKKSSIDALSNQELQALVTRMNLEQQYSQLSEKNKSAGRKTVEKLLGAPTDGVQEEVYNRAKRAGARIAVKMITGI